MIGNNMKKKNFEVLFVGLKNNLIFIVLVCVFLFLLIIRVFTVQEVEWFSGGEYLFEVIMQLSLGSVVSVFFYLLLVYLPGYRKHEYICANYFVYSIALISNYIFLVIEDINDLESVNSFLM
jgi:hypothetical protein